MSRARFIAVLCAAAAVTGGSVAVLAGRGGDDEAEPERTVAEPLGEALAYLPADAPMVAVVQTGGKQVQAAGQLLDALLVGPIVVRQLTGSLGLDFEQDVEPLLGHPLALATTRTPGLDLRALLRDGGVAAMVASDAERLREVVDEARDAGRLREADGAPGTFTTRGGVALAVDGPVLVLGGSAASVRAAIERRAARTGLRREDFTRRTDQVAPASGDAGEALVTLTAPAEKLVDLAGIGTVPNADALTDGALAVRVEDPGVAIRFSAAADQAKVVPEEIPLPTGPEPPRPAGGDAPLVLAVRDARQTIGAIRATDGSTNIAALRSIEEALDELDKVSGPLKTFGRIDFDEALFDQLTGTTTITREGGGTVVRAELQDGDPLRTALDRIEKVPAFAYELAGIDGVALDREGDEAYVLKLEGEKPVRLAVLDTTLVATTSTTIGLRAVANREPERVETRGALHARLRRPGDLLIRRFGLPGGVSFLLAGLGPLDVAVQAERTGLTGSATLTVAR